MNKDSHVVTSKINSFPREYQQREHLSAKNCTIFNFMPDNSHVYCAIPEHHYDISGMAIIDYSHPSSGIDLQVCFFKKESFPALDLEYMPIEYCTLTEQYTNCFLTLYSFDSNYTRSNILIRYKESSAEHCVIINLDYV
jgi:hypothetical protein